MLELDAKLEDFMDIRIEVSNYRQVVKNKYDPLDLSKVNEVKEIIDNFKRKHLDIILV